MEKTNVTPEETQRAVISKRAEQKGRREIAKKIATLKRVKVEYVPVGDLRPNIYNPNRQTEREFELLLRSMEEDGFTQPIVVNLVGIIVDGEHRWRAAQVLSMKEIPVVRVDMSEEQMRISTIRHNRARGSHDPGLEADVLRDLQQLGALDWAKDSLMLDDKDLNRLLTTVPIPETLAEKDFSTAWIPKQQDKETAEERQLDSGIMLASAATPRAVEEMQKRNVALSAAKTTSAREAAQQTHKTYQFTLVYASQEAVLVRNILGAQPAVALLGLCREELVRQAA